MARFTRQQILDRLNAKIRSGQPIVGGGAGTGLSAKCEEDGGIDLIVIYNSGRYRMAGRGSLAGLLAYGNANDIVMEMAREVLPVARKTPVLAGVNGTDPFCIFDSFLDQLKAVGFAGVQNFPTVGLIDGVFRQNLEETGMGFGLEVDMIRMAHAKDMLTTPYVFSEDDAIAMTEAGADVIVCHMGLTTGGAIGAGHGQNLGRLCGSNQCVERSGAEKAPRHYHPVPRWADLHARGCRVRSEALSGMQRVLRRLLDGAAAHRKGPHRTNKGISQDQAPLRAPGESVR